MNGEEPDISFDVLSDGQQNPKSHENTKTEDSMPPKNVENAANEENVTNVDTIVDSKPEIEEGIQSNDTNKVMATNSSAITISEVSFVVKINK